MDYNLLTSVVLRDTAKNKAHKEINVVEGMVVVVVVVSVEEGVFTN